MIYQAVNTVLKLHVRTITPWPRVNYIVLYYVALSLSPAVHDASPYERYSWFVSSHTNHHHLPFMVQGFIVLTCSKNRK